VRVRQLAGRLQQVCGRDRRGLRHMAVVQPAAQVSHCVDSLLQRQLGMAVGWGREGRGGEGGLSILQLAEIRLERASRRPRRARRPRRLAR
jgi:hypothetical protein